MDNKTYSVYFKNEICVSGLTYNEALDWITSKLSWYPSCGHFYEIYEDDGVVNN